MSKDRTQVEFCRCLWEGKDCLEVQHQEVLVWRFGCELAREGLFWNRILSVLPFLPYIFLFRVQFIPPFTQQANVHGPLCTAAICRALYWVPAMPDPLSAPMVCWRRRYAFCSSLVYSAVTQTHRVPCVSKGRVIYQLPQQRLVFPVWIWTKCRRFLDYWELCLSDFSLPSFFSCQLFFNAAFLVPQPV